jgi:hypothetical protein
VSHRSLAEVVMQALRDASDAQDAALRTRNDAIRRARADRVPPKALAEWYDLSPERIRRICKERE